MKEFSLLLIGVLFLAGCGSPGVEAEDAEADSKESIQEHYSEFPRDSSFWEQAFSKNFESDEVLNGKVYGGIIPHHLLVKDVTGSYFKLLAEHTDPEVVVVIGPNHFEQGYSILSSKYPFKSLFGYLEPELSIINGLEKNGILQINEKVFEEEHSITSEVSYIKKLFPEAKFVPIVLRVNVKEEDLQAIAEYLHQNLPEESLVLASVDFSHYISADAAQFHDLKSIADIESFNYPEIQNIEVDSPNSIFTLLKYLEKRGKQDIVKFKNTNSGYYLNKLDFKETTSYLWSYFVEGQPKARNLNTKMIFPNMKMSADEAISLLKGGENRFFRGVDEIFYYYFEDLSVESGRFFNKYGVKHLQEESPLGNADYILGKVEGDTKIEFKFFFPEKKML